jgi:uncharacterized protein (DUF2062 family)
MGIVPIWGLQMAVAIALAFILRLNKALVILSANISIPPMIPLILFASHRVGGLWRGEQAQTLVFNRDLTLEAFGQNLTQYLIGAITLAILAGGLTGLITFVLLKLFKRSTS